MFKYVLVPSHCLKESNSLQVSFTLNEELTMIEGLEKRKAVSAPREHNFTMQSVGGQTLTVFTENASGDFLFSSAPIYTLLLWLVSLVNYPSVLEPKDHVCGLGGGSSSHSAFFYIAHCPHAHLLFCAYLFRIQWDFPFLFFTKTTYETTFCVLRRCKVNQDACLCVWLLHLVWCIYPLEGVSSAWVFGFTFPSWNQLNTEQIGFNTNHYWICCWLSFLKVLFLVWFEFGCCCVLSAGAGELVCHCFSTQCVLAGLHKYHTCMDGTQDGHNVAMLCWDESNCAALSWMCICACL